MYEIFIQNPILNWILTTFTFMSQFYCWFWLLNSGSQACLANTLIAWTILLSSQIPLFLLIRKCLIFKIRFGIQRNVIYFSVILQWYSIIWRNGWNFYHTLSIVTKWLYRYSSAMSHSLNFLIFRNASLWNISSFQFRKLWTTSYFPSLTFHYYLCCSFLTFWYQFSIFLIRGKLCQIFHTNSF